jgi:uncharacterized membrane protein (UPF0182 family)
VAFAELPAARSRWRWRALLALLVLLLLSARAIARLVIEYQWWKEIEQVPVWFGLISYGVLPIVAASVVALAAMFIAHQTAMSHARARRTAGYTRLAALVLLLISAALAASTIDSWSVVRFFGSREAPADPAAWRDPVFDRPLAFYLFDLPFYSALRRFAVGLALAVALVYWLTRRIWHLKENLPQFERGGEIDLRDLNLAGGLESKFLRAALALFLLGLAWRFYLGRFELLVEDHGFMVGVEWVSERITLPLQWMLIAWAAAAAALVWFGRWLPAASLVAGLAAAALVPKAVSAIYVRPNEISLQRPYIDKHIQATRSAFGLTKRTREIEFTASLATRIQPASHKVALDNVRLWDWRAFHDTTTQIQALRPYYVFRDSDVDRYIIDGRLRQVLLSPRELDVSQIAEARARWPISRFFYTHGYGMVMAEANRITPDGLPELFVQDAPARLRTDSLKLTRPEIYYGEAMHEPVFVHTAQEEFNYPSGNENVLSRYDGRGGFPVASLPIRIAAALAEADVNILLTNFFTADSRMMIRRRIRDRISALAGFIEWDADPYLVLTDEGRLVWTIDGYTTSDGHPYARRWRHPTLGTFNYIRNSVKATIDAYSGEVRLYIFDPSDPVIQAYRSLFPTLFQPASAMPADLRRHTRYPETLFRTQAEVYRTYHMSDSQAFYNKEDIWDIARNVYQNDTRPVELPPTFVIAALPGEPTPEFMLTLPFTPRNKDNMIGLMVGRCDGDNLGELVFLQLSKQELVFGPMQIEARINQDQIISKDLSLWNQQGSQVLRGHIMVLPVGDTFLYVEPIYIQSSEARMPQLRKVVLAVGNELIYRDTYEQALADLGRLAGASPPPRTVTEKAPEPGRAPPVQVVADGRLDEIRAHMRRYRDLAAQGKWADAGKELEAVEALLGRR